MTDFNIKLGGRMWEVRFKTRRTMPSKHKLWGMCDREEGSIYIRRDLSAKNMLDTLIHEVRPTRS